MVSYFTDKYEIRGIIWKSMLLWGFTCFFVRPSEYLPNSTVLMGIGETLNGLLLVFFMTTWLPVMIEEGERIHPNRKLKVADKWSAIANCTLEIDQALGPIYGSYMFVLKLFQSNWNNKVMDSNKKFAMENVLLVQTICAFLALY